MKTGKRFIVISVFALLLTCSLLAQKDIENPLKLDDKILAAIFAAFGVGLFGIIGFIKNLFKTQTWTDLARDIFGYTVSLLASAGCTIAVLTSAQKFTILRFIIYTFGVWIEASGIWKAIKEAIQKQK